ncbi:hypothetical protein BRO54_1533 [Geobacillus proteiniphilus]|uniref:Uncharacterized protein n=1 Tax=Geobacillus proteiniphilus TaxID=860353 RepID=A0A1Q5T374_9BACL|nr:hypothetical protein BRO54_1533 [Geobacillus proteiniphilus]
MKNSDTDFGAFVVWRWRRPAVVFLFLFRFGYINSIWMNVA